MPYTQSLRRAVKVGGKQLTVHTVIGEKNCNPSETLFWRNEHKYLCQTILQQLINLLLLMKKCCIKYSSLYEFSMNPVQGSQGIDEADF